MTFQHNDFKIEGSSVSGMATCFVVSPYKVAIDIGTCTPESIKCQWVFITHAHIDHMGAAAQHAATRDMMAMPPTKFVCSAEVAQGLDKILKTWGEIQGNFKYAIRIVNPGESVEIGKGIRVEAFEAFHRVPSQGYAFIRTISKLKPEFVGIEGVEIGRMVREGIQVKDSAEAVEMVFTGDSKSEIHANAFIPQAKIVVTEATFVNASVPVEEAREKGHTHLDEIVEHADRFSGCVKIVVTHFSNRHSQEDIDQAIAQMPEGIREKVFAM